MVDRPPPQPLAGASYSQLSSSSSVPSVASAADEQTQSSTSALSTSPSGRLTFVFPPTRKSHPPAAQRRLQDNALVALPSSTIFPAPMITSEESSPKRRIAFPERSASGPLKIVTDNALSSLLGPHTNNLNPSRAPSNLEDWVSSSRQTIITPKVQPEDQIEDEDK